MSFIVDYRVPDNMVLKLSKYGQVYKSTKADTKDDAVSGHPDLQIHFVNNNTAFVAPSIFTYYKSILPKNINLYTGTTEITSTYPSCSAYNVAKIGNNVLLNKKYTDNTIIDYYTNNNLNIIHVNQGYTKCNACIVADKILLTEDDGIFKVLTNKTKDIKTYKLEKGHVNLKGYDYGFIGGATGYSCKHGILFGCGSFEKHPNIINILNKHNVKYISLSDDKLYDYGTIIEF